MNGSTRDEAGGFQLLTSVGPAGIAVVRVWGPRGERFLQTHVRTATPLTSTTWTRGRVLRAQLIEHDGAPIDDILVSLHGTAASPETRLHLHGNPCVVRRCTALAAACGLVPADEWQRALWEAVNPLEAEALALLPRMLTLRGAYWLLHQVHRLHAAADELLTRDPDDETRRRCRQIARRAAIVDWFTRPLRIALAGPPNAGKSTLANALTDQTVCIVSAAPGTTRDWIEIPGELNGHPVLWVDTPGLRETSDAVEVASVAAGRRVLAAADAQLLVLDATRPAADALYCEGHRELRPACVALNKCDLRDDTAVICAALPSRWRETLVEISATRRSGLDRLAACLLDRTGRSESELAEPAAFAARQVDLLNSAAETPDRKSFHRKILGLLSSSARE